MQPKKVKIKPKANNNDEKILVQADKHRINQVISNLISNSIKFTKDRGGTISIKVTPDDYNTNAITVSVKDTGTGIDPEIMPRLFTKFATKSDAGTGLDCISQKAL